MGRWTTVTAEIELSDIDDDDIAKEYTDRFGGDGVLMDDNEWTRLFELRKYKPQSEFLKAIDEIIMNKTGRIL
jgi:hypothetical protein